ncbi:suppressor of fused domain protein [Paenarthrobacter nitroguajacolicus]|uniref:Suppressor of fused domain protein n=1 Tax=Paenarthrobacter nitroguajacolicus TaxID=211146 RepID=A0A558H6Y1_PAENT|nr:suppressor of fused domain protein [Paenarthrobacter nitroguajacolicus]TVU64863.1 suppressor of fused domain protein [Paenarthrobacter nitroguajacolicus]
MPTRVEQFLSHLDGLTGGIEPRFFPVEPSRPGVPSVTVIVYDDIPESGLLTGITYGVSLADHPLWRFGKPELCICVKSEDIRWALAIGHIGEVQRGDNPFRYGDTINFGERIAPDSEMTSFVIFAPAVMDHSDYAGIDLGEVLPINICGLYPIHDSERRYIHDHGLEAFWKLDWDPYDVKRPSAV